MIDIKSFNADACNTSRIIKAQYFKMGAANVLDVNNRGVTTRLQA